MGASHGNFVKYPRTPHLFGARGTPDDKRMNERDSLAFIGDESLIVEEKLDGTNVGIHFSGDEMILQCRGHLITEGMHAQYDLFKQWTTAKRTCLEGMLDQRYILFGEWMYAKHTIGYRELPHYFFEFDIWDKKDETFLLLDRRLELLAGKNIQTVPVVHRGPIKRKDLEALVAQSAFASQFEHPASGRTDSIMEGLYLRTENDHAVTGRAKMVRPEFVEKINQSTHWQHTAMIANELVEGADIWS